MRGTLLLAALVLVGCGKDGGGGGGSRASSLPVSRLPAEARVEVDALNAFYAGRPPFKKHPREGERVLCKMLSIDAWGAKDDEFKPVILAESGGGFRRPSAIFRLSESQGFKTGDDYYSTLYIEGTLRGPVAFDAAPWAKSWAKLEATSPRAAAYFILVDDARLVAEPK